MQEFLRCDLMRVNEPPIMCLLSELTKHQHLPVPGSGRAAASAAEHSLLFREKHRLQAGLLQTEK